MNKKPILFRLPQQHTPHFPHFSYISQPAGKPDIFPSKTAHYAIAIPAKQEGDVQKSGKRREIGYTINQQPNLTQWITIASIFSLVAQNWFWLIDGVIAPLFHPPPQAGNYGNRLD